MTCSTWTQTVAAGVTWWMAPEYRQQLVGAGDLPLAEWLRDGKARLIKQGPHRVVYRVDLPGLSCFVKRKRMTGKGRKIARARAGKAEFKALRKPPDNVFA